MIRSFEVKLNAAHPELPLFEATAIVGAASTAFIKRVPASVGSWHISKVFVEATYPDGSVNTIEAKVGAEGVWTATLPACNTSGRVKSGFVIFANGVDELGEPVTGYLLGVADMAIYTRDLQIVPGPTGYVLKYFDVAPETPKKGDVAPIDNVIKMYDGTQWVSLGGASDYSELDNKPSINDVELDGNKTGAALGLLSLIGGTLTGGVDFTNKSYPFCINKLPPAYEANLANTPKLADIASKGFIGWFPGNGSYLVMSQYDLNGWPDMAWSDGEHEYGILIENRNTDGSVVLDYYNGTASQSYHLQPYGGDIAMQYYIALAFSASKDYAQGAIVYKDGFIYKALVPHRGAWNASHFELTTIGDAIAAATSEAEGKADPSLIGIPAFSTELTYTVGAKVVYSNAVWNCTTAVETAGAWTGTTNWTKLFDLATDAPASGGTSLITNGQIFAALAGTVSKAGDTMTGGLTVPNLTVGSRKANTTVGQYSSAQGFTVEASGVASHAEGRFATAKGIGAHAEGSGTANGDYSHAEGGGVAGNGVLGGSFCHAEGSNTSAQNFAEHAEGCLNASHRSSSTWGDSGNTLTSTGFGADTNRRNAKETMQDGKTYIYGIGGYDGTNPNTTGVKDLATAVNDKVDKTVPAAAGNIATLTATGGLADSGVDVATALRYALGATITASATLADRTMNKVEPLATNTEDIELSFPPTTSGKARDFLVLINNPTGNTGTITFTPPAGATIYGDGLEQTFAEGETWEVTITEIAKKQFLAKAVKMEASVVPPPYWGMYIEAEEDGVVVSATSRWISDLNGVAIESSTDANTWTTFASVASFSPVQGSVTLAHEGDRVYFRARAAGNTAVCTYYGGSKSGITFATSGKCGAHGNIMSLLNASNEDNVTLTANYSFYGLFQNCTSLTSAPDLPATTLTNGCYMSMFQGCTSLMKSPALPATTLTGSCYRSMFYGCTGMTKASEISATTMATGSCYSMFFGCTSLASAPALPATTLADNCYESMFSGCTALTAAPNLPATTTAAQSYRGMFYGCTSLASVSVAFTNWSPSGQYDFDEWLRNVASSGTFTCPSALGTNATIERGYSRCPNNWTVVNV